MLAPMPERGRIYEQRRTVGPADVGADGRAHLDALARWLQDAAFADVLEADLPESSGWIVRRTLMVLGRRPTFAESLRIRTFCAGLAKSVAERRTTIEDGDGVLVEAEAAWVQVDPQTRLPTRFSPRFLDVYAEAAAGRRARSRLRHPAPPPAPEVDEEFEWEFRTADLDLAGHVNNAVYWQIAEQHLPGAGEADAIEIEYREGAGAGRARLRRRGDTIWVLGDEDAVSASITLPS